VNKDNTQTLLGLKPPLSVEVKPLLDHRTNGTTTSDYWTQVTRRWARVRERKHKERTELKQVNDVDRNVSSRGPESAIKLVLVRTPSSTIS